MHFDKLPAEDRERIIVESFRSHGINLSAVLDDKSHLPSQSTEKQIAQIHSAVADLRTSVRNQDKKIDLLAEQLSTVLEEIRKTNSHSHKCSV